MFYIFLGGVFLLASSYSIYNPAVSKSILLTIAYNGFYFFTRLASFLTGSYKCIKKHLPRLSFQEPKSIYLINNNGDIVKKYGINEVEEINTKDYYVPDYNFVIYFWVSPNDKKYNSYVLRFNSLKDFNDRFEFCRYKFLAPRVHIETDNEKITYELSNQFAKNNYYMSGNILFDHAFICWMLKEYYNYTLKENIRYTVDFLDDNINLITLNDTKCVILDKMDYSISNKDECYKEYKNVGLRHRNSIL